MSISADGTATRGESVARNFLAFICILIPWINPFAPGPSPSVVPWLITLAATAALFVAFTRTEKTMRAAVDGGFQYSSTGFAAWAWLVAGMVSSCLGLLQYFGAAATFNPWIDQTDAGLAFANLRQRNQFASLTNIALAALIWIVQSHHDRRNAKPEGSKGILVMVFSAAMLLMIGNAASSSRTGLLQILLLYGVSAIWGTWRLPPVRQVLFAALVAYAVSSLALPWMAGLDPSLHGMAARLRAGDAPCASRLTLWSNVLHLIAQKPWLGWGWGELDYAHYMTLYEGPRFCEILDNAHNLPLHLAVELGVPAAILICGAFFWWVVKQKPWLEADSTRQLAWAVLAVILLHSMLEYPLWYGPFQVAAGLCVYLLWRTGSPAPDTIKAIESSRKSAVASVFIVVFAMLMLALAIYAAWDYHRISQIYLPPESRDKAYREDTLNKIRGSWLFGNQVRFAELVVTPLERGNAAWTFQSANALLHYSPEPRIAQKVIESAVMLGRDGDAIAQLARYRAAFPEEYAIWVRANANTISNLQQFNK